MTVIYLCVHGFFADPYVIAEMYWRPIIIVLGIIAAAIIIIIMMLVFAWLKARSRTKERLDRRNSLRQSIRSSKASVLANSRANLTTPTPSGKMFFNLKMPAKTLLVIFYVNTHAMLLMALFF